MPSPAITACLIVLLEPISVPRSSSFSGIRRNIFERNARSRARLPNEEMFLRDPLGDVARPRADDRRRDDDEGWSPNSGADRHIPRRPAHQRDIEIAAFSASMVLARLPTNSHMYAGIPLLERRHQPGREIFGGRNDAESDCRPCRRYRVHFLEHTHALIDRPGRFQNTSPASVGRMPSGVRSNSVSPSSSSNCLSWKVTAGAVAPTPWRHRNFALYGAQGRNWRRVRLRMSIVSKSN